MTTHDQFRNIRFFASLDGLRAISILAVIWQHTKPSWVPAPVASLGTQGVPLFFAISGFLITTLLLRERERRGRIDMKAFYVRRALRIFPLYYGTLLLYVVAVAVLERDSAAGQGFWGNIGYFATYTSNFFVGSEQRTIFYFAWSLAIEEQYYLLWPTLLTLCRTTFRASALLIGVFVVGLVVQYRFIEAIEKIPYGIVAGSLFAVVAHSEYGFRYLNALVGQRWSVLAIVTLLATCLAAGVVNAALVNVLLAGLVAGCAMNDEHALHRIFRFGPLTYLGTISYGVYLLHMLCKNAIDKLTASETLPFAGLHSFVLTTALATIVATVSFRYYESFFLKRKAAYLR